MLRFINDNGSRILYENSKTLSYLNLGSDALIKNIKKIIKNVLRINQKICSINISDSGKT